MRLKKIIITISAFLFSAITLLSAQPTLAQKLIIDATGKSDCQEKLGLSATECGDYAISDFLSLAINLSQIILGLVGSLTLLMLFVSGLQFLFSAGSKEKVESAKKRIIASVVGLLIVFSSWLIINFVFKTMGLEWKGEVSIPEKTK